MQPQIWTGVNWVLIAAIIAGSAVLAYLGDVLGFKYGKQRISLFGLRPRYTSRLITAFTGVFISVTVLAVLSFFSDNVRTALFTMKYLRQDLDRTALQLRGAQDDLEKSRYDLRESQSLWHTAAVSLDIARFDLAALQNDRDLLISEKTDLESSLSSLREEIEELRLEQDIMRRGAIAVQANALLAQRVAPPGASAGQAREILAALREDAGETAADLLAWRAGVTDAEVSLSFSPDEEDRLAETISKADERVYVRVLAAENFAVGEAIEVRLESGPSYLLYNAGDILHRELVEPGREGFSAEDTLHAFLRRVKTLAIGSGVLPDPATNSVGALEGEEFFDVVEQLKSMTLPTIINAVVLADIYTEGPVSIKITLE